MASLLDWVPVFQESVDTIRARVNADANPGIDPSDPVYLDTTPGGFFYDITQSVLLEIARLWDAAGTEVPAAAFPAYAWGTFLDEHGITVNTPRKDATFATGVVTFTAPNGTLIATGTRVSVPKASAADDAITFAVTSGGIVSGTSIDLAVSAELPGSASNVTAGAITVLSSPVTGVASVSNAIPTGGGSDIETDEPYRARILLAFAGAHGAGTIGDYEVWALAYPGVGFVKVEPLWAGPGTVRLQITDVDNHPVSSGVIDGLQAQLDPIAGQGEGLAPIGAIVTVATPTVEPVTVTAAVTYAPGYSVDGTAGTIAIGTEIIASIEAYLNRLAPGDDVVLQHVVGRFFAVAGVYDVSDVELNGTTANVTIVGSHVAESGGVTLS